MKYLPIYNELIGCKNETAAFDYLLRSLKLGLCRWDYFVNWEKVLGSIQSVEMDLHLFDFVVGKTDASKALAQLLESHPQVIRLIPLLVASREHRIGILKDYRNGAVSHEEYDFTFVGSLTSDQVLRAVEFAKNSGVLDLLSSKRISSVVDYVLGVETGLDTHARKQRGGNVMEEIIEYYISGICARRGWQYIEQATSKSVLHKWGIELASNKTHRIVDFAVLVDSRIWVIECNFYGGVGSKLKSTAGEYKNVWEFWKNAGHGFIWITDGKGWTSTRRALEETFAYIDYTLSLEMVAKGLLEGILTTNAED